MICLIGFVEAVIFSCRQAMRNVKSTELVCDFTSFFHRFDRLKNLCIFAEEELSEATLKRDLRVLEDFVRHYSGKILHPNHYLLLLAKRNYLFISRKHLIDLMSRCSLEEQNELKAAFK